VQVNKYPVLFVAWTDVIQGAVGWESMEDRLDDADNRSGIVHQTGFLIEETEDNIIIVDSYLNDEDMVGSYHKIPKSIIIQRLELK
jgi:hypothetical protein